MEPTRDITVTAGDLFTVSWEIPPEAFGRFPYGWGAIFANPPEDGLALRQPKGLVYFHADLTRFGGNPSTTRPTGTLEWKTAPTRSDSMDEGGWFRTSLGRSNYDPRANMSMNPGVWHLWIGSDFMPGEHSTPVLPVITVRVNPAPDTGPAQPLAPGNGDVAIVLGDVPREVRALDDLKDYLKRLTGQAGPVYRNIDTNAAPAQIHVGRSAWVDRAAPDLAGMDFEGFIIRGLRGDDGINHLILAGHSHRGTGFAVTRYLMKYGGVRWLMPGDLGLEIPKLDGVPVPEDAAIREEPTCQSRHFIGDRHRDIHERWFIGRRWDGWNHNLAAILPVTSYGKTHPEYYAQFADGTPRPGVQACTTNPDVIRILTQTAREFCDAEPYMMSISLSSNDGGGHCQCARCRALDKARAPAYSVTDRYFTFANAVAEGLAQTHPGKGVGVHAYSYTADPPVQIKVRDNVCPFITLSFATGMRRPHEVIEHLQDWAAQVKQFAIYQYVFSQFPYVAMFTHCPHALADLQREANALGCVASAAEVIPVWASDAPKLWCFANVMWNDQASVDELMDDWCRHAYGPAAEPMRRFFDRWEAVYEARGEAHRYEMALRWWPRYGDEYSLVSADDLEGMIDDIAAAKALAVEKRRRTRIELVHKTFRLTRFFIESGLLMRQLESTAAGGEPVDVDAILSSGRRLLSLQTERAEYFQWLIKDNDPLVFAGPIAPEAGLNGWHHENSVIARENAAIALAMRRVMAAGADVPTPEGTTPTDMLLLAAARLLSMPQAMHAGNLLANPGFEAVDPDRPDQPVGWDAYQTYYNEGAVLRCNEDEARNGNRSASLFNGMLTGSGYRQTVAVKGGVWYLVSAWVKGKLADPSNENFSLVIRWQGTRGSDEAIRLEGGPGDAWLGIPQRAFRDWTQVVGIVHLPSSADSATVLLEVASGPRERPLLVDDACLIPIRQGE